MPNDSAPAPNAPEGVRLRLEKGFDPLRVRASVEILASHPDYSGHFPERPVLPASSQFEIIEAVARAAFGDALRLVAVPRAKFLASSNLVPRSKPNSHARARRPLTSITAFKAMGKSTRVEKSASSSVAGAPAVPPANF